MKYIYNFSTYTLLFLFSFLTFPNTSNAQSVLAEGHWYKLAIEKDGLYKLSYQDFVSMGFDMTNLDPFHIQVYGNVEGLLPEPNNIVVPVGLIENAIYVHGAEDGSFDEEDYVAFYAQGPDEWQYERLLERFRYYGHSYDDLNYYFVGNKNMEGKRIQSKNSLSNPAFKTIDSFLDYQSHEVDLVNFIKSGRKWFGESFEDYGTLELSFDFPNFINEKNVKFGVYAAGRSSLNSTIIIEPLGSEIQEITVPKVVGDYTYAKEVSDRLFYATNADEVKLDLSYSQPDASSNAWLDYIEVNAYRRLKMHEHQMSFNFDVLLDEDEVFEFNLSNSTEQIKIWEVTNPYNVKSIENFNFNNDTTSFKLLLDRTHYFIAFDEQGFMTPEFIGEVPSQNLKALEPFKMAIVTIDEFKEEAQRLADFHLENDDMVVVVVTTEEIYNEFSSGKQDPTAIRNFMRYYYNENEEGEKPEYLLLFGDASYDYRDVIPGNTNKVPVYQSVGSTKLTDSYNTDDYFGIMGQLDGDSSFGEIQISIGRFPVNTIEDAKIMVDKSIHYASNQQAVMGDWRNKVCFIADDEDSNLHFNDSNELADTFLLSHPEFNVDKIFLDSYVQQTTPNGKRYPDVTDAINKSVEEGVLFFNYTGHGGHIALAEERILQIPDILSWKNYDKLGVWIVASCEFGPFDDPGHISAGEHVVLNPYGGGVALFTTTRLAYASYNFKLNKKFHEIAFSRNEEGAYYHLGEIIKYAKNESGNKKQNLNFVLLGDPALKMVYPEYHVETTHINDSPITNESNDTIKARQTIEVKGKVTGLDHQILSNYNGLVDINVYGKPSVYSTLANDPRSYKASFDVIDLVIYKGQSRAVNGEFEFSFVVPSSIGSSFGSGKISYYTMEQKSEEAFFDANGGYSNFIIGGVDESIENDLLGPDITIHLDSYNFKSGDPTSNQPVMMIDLFDENGINNVQLGFGKEIKAQLDNQLNYYLNDHYIPENNSYQKGQIEYKLDELELGNHEITVKAWDMFDNASEKSVNFIVIGQETINIYDVMNYPNPFNEFTDFVFSHNQTDESELEVKIYLYDIIGKIIWTYESKVNVLGNSIEPIHFETGDQSISNLKTGVYSYVLEVQNKEAQKVFQKQKLLIVK